MLAIVSWTHIEAIAGSPGTDMSPGFRKYRGYQLSVEPGASARASVRGEAAAKSRANSWRAEVEVEHLTRGTIMSGETIG